MYTFRYYVLASLIIYSNVDAVRILGLFPHTGKSHQMVFEPLLHKLAERGHHLTVVSFFPSKNPPANYTDVSLQGIAQLGVEVVDLNIFEEPLPPFLFHFESIYKQITDFGPLADMALNVCKKLVSWPPLLEAFKKDYDLVLAENFNSDCLIGLARANGITAPIVALSSNFMMPWSAERIGVIDNPSYWPVISTRFTDRMNFFERLENVFVKVYFKLWFRHAIQVKEQEIIEKYLGRKIPDLQDVAMNTSLLLLNTFHSLNGVRPLVPGVVEVAGMHLNEERKPIPLYMERFINESEHGVILFSFGSLIRTASMPKYKEEIIVNALSKLKQRVIWKYEDSGDEGTLIGNILRVKWIPQYDLLRHPKVIAFIAHGGLLGMTEAISAGKPMVIVPFFGDQDLNAAAASAAGFAKTLNYVTLDEKSITEALESVISAEMRISARRASQIWKDRQNSPLDTAVYWVERVARWGPYDKLHSAAREMSFVQLSLLDVFAVVVVAVAGILLTVIYLVYSIIKFVSANVNKNVKKKIH